MNTSAGTFSTGRLSRSEQADLLDYLPEDAVRFEAQPLDPGELGDPVTAIATIALSMTGITAICAWLGSKGRTITMTMKAHAPGVATEISFTVTDKSIPAEVKEELEKRGAKVVEP